MFLFAQFTHITYSGAQARGAPWVPNFGKSFDARKFGYDVSVHPDCRGGGGEERRPLGRGCAGKFPWREIAWPALHLASRVFLAGNHIDCRRFSCSIKASLTKLFALLWKSLRSSSKDCEQQSPSKFITFPVFLFEPVRISVWVLRAAKWIGCLC